MPLDQTHMVNFRFTQPPLGVGESAPTISLQSAALYQSPNGANWGELMYAGRHIEHLASLPAGWDGYGALAISNETKLNAQRSLEVICRGAPVPDIVPNANGTISFEWDTRAGSAHLEIGQTKFSFSLRSSVSGLDPILLDGAAEDVPSAIAEQIVAMLYPERTTTPTVNWIVFTGRQAMSA